VSEPLDRVVERRWPEVDVLEALLSEARLARVDGVLAQRLASITAVFENVWDPHNVAACMRSCEGFGVQDVHIITELHGYRPPGGITMSAHRWLTSHRHKTSTACIERLRAQGFSLWVSDLEATERLHELPVQGPIALVVGNEVEGVSETMRAAADRRFLLPMAGMVQSFNLSVALALCLHAVVPPRRASLGGRGDLSLERQWRLRRRWLEYTIRNARAVRREYGDTRDDEPDDRPDPPDKEPADP
jgi:tRNA (guanosine-2'-O-)-methyltransferase